MLKENREEVESNMVKGDYSRKEKEEGKQKDNIKIRDKDVKQYS